MCMTISAIENGTWKGTLVANFLAQIGMLNPTPTDVVSCRQVGLWQSSLPGFIFSSINSHTHAGTALNYTLQGGLMQLVLGKPFSTVLHDQDKSI